MISKIAITIPVYNGLKYLQKSLPPIIKQIEQIKNWKFRIIVIDDNSTDGTTNWLNESYPDIIVLNGNGSLWWSGGVNLGVKHALINQEYKYVLLWNHDTICADDYFKTLVGTIPKYDATTIITSKIFFLVNPNVIFNHGAFFNPRTGKNTLNGYGMVDSEQFNKPVQVDWTGGMGTLIPAEVFQQVGLFDQKNFPQYYGDCDFFLRTKEKGFKIMAVPELKIWNDKSNSGLEHKGKWRLFFQTLFSIKSNHNIIVQYKFLRRHGKSPMAFFFYLFGIALHFASFIKHWIKGFFK